MDLLLELLPLDADAGLLGLEKVERDGVGVGHLDELEPLGLQPGQTALGAGQLLRVVGVAPEGGFEISADSFGVELIKMDPQRPVALNAPFDVAGLQVRQIASGLLVALAASEVVEDVSAPALAGCVDHAASAAGAGQESAQVVGVAALLDRVLLALVQDELYAVEQVRPDDGGVLAGVLDPAVGDDTEVVAVAQELGQLRQRQGLLGLPRCRPGREPLGGQLGVQALEGVLAGGVQLEGPSHVRAPFRVELHRADLAALHEVAHVQVPDGHPVGGATHGGLLGRAFEDLRSQVGAVELGQVGHDVVHELARRRVVDGFGHADESGTGLLDGHLDLDVVGPVAGQPVDLVHDDEVDVLVFGQQGEHLLQCGPGCGLGRLAPIGKLGHHGGTKFGSLAGAGIALGGDGIALRGSVSVRLPGG